MIYLPYQEKDEKILLVLRRIWIVFFKHLLFVLFLLVLPFVIYLLVLNFAPEYLDTLVFRIAGIFFGLYLLFVLLFALISWINYYFDVWIVTSKKIISIDQIGLFERTTSEARHERVQDIMVEVRGFLPTLLHFGNVYVQTAAEAPRFAFMQIKNPYRVKRLLSQLHSQALQKEELGYQRTRPSEEKPEYLEEKIKEIQKEKKPKETKPKKLFEGLGKISDYRK